MSTVAPESATVATVKYDFMNISIDQCLGRAAAPCPATGDIDELAISAQLYDELCHTDAQVPLITPHQLRQDRIDNWPAPQPSLASVRIFDIYTRVKATGMPNMLEAKIPVPSLLKLDVWRAIATGHPDDHIVLDGITYGFPIQYTGPKLDRENKVAHSSATKFMTHVRSYVQKECENLAMMGPYTVPPFVPWTNISPLMSRPKGDSTKRRIIVDLSYPPGANVNDFVFKNVLFGLPRAHTLPTVAHAVEAIKEKGFDVLIATLDIERAYRNIPSCPLDLPLLGISVDGKYYVDAAMPFGSRNSSCYMQLVAEFIVRALAARGIRSHMYLDDMIVYLETGQDCNARLLEIIRLYRALGLPVAFSKLQSPAKVATFLGVKIDLNERSLAIPQSKITQFLILVQWLLGQDSVDIKVVQSLIGKINHISQCVQPARLFMGRILQAYRESAGERQIAIQGMKADLHWFALFLRRFNGKSMIKNTSPAKIILADSSPSGGGATDMSRYYEYVYSTAMSQAHHITCLEAINCLIALRTLLHDGDNHSTIELRCDSEATINALAFGRARNKVLNAVARAVWYIQAQRDINIVYTHVPGESMALPDAFSRAHLSKEFRRKADAFIHKLSLKRVTPKRYAPNYKNFM